MPARNVAGYVEPTLDSIFAQTRLPDEIVVADGHSTDDTVASVLRYEGRGVPVRVVKNDTIFAGGGRNAATRAARHDLLVNMDFGNRAEPRWLEEMVRPFEKDPALDLLGGVFVPTFDTPFERVFAAAFYTVDCLLPTMRREEMETLAPADFVPGGMCMAYRRSIWERAGGFCEWSRKGQDRLFGRRVRHIGGKLAFTLDARVHHHMARSFRSLIERHFFYDLWAARQGLPAPWVQRVVLAYVLGLSILLVSTRSPGWLFALLPLFVTYVQVRAWRKLDRVAALTPLRFGWREKLLAIPILLIFDAAVFLGRTAGTIDRWLRSSWREKTRAYLEFGC
jgi:GT2 family glycosyltransferase